MMVKKWNFLLEKKSDSMNFLAGSIFIPESAKEI